MRVTCMLNACQTRSERSSDACVIELFAGLYRILVNIKYIFRIIIITSQSIYFFTVLLLNSKTYQEVTC